MVVLPNTDPSTGAPSSPGTLMFQDTEVPPKAEGLSAPPTITQMTPCTWQLPATDAAGALTSDGSCHLSFSAAGGYWSLTTGVCGISTNCLQPIGAYDVVPFGTNAQDLGSSTHNWFHMYSEFVVTQLVDIGNGVTTYSEGLGTDPGGHTNALLLTILPSTPLMSFDSFGNYSYEKLLPNATDSLDLGASGLEWNNLYVKNLHCTGTGCPTGYWNLTTSGVCGAVGTCLQPVGSYDVVPFGTNTQDLGSSSHNWFHMYSEFVVTQLVDIGNGVTTYSEGLGTDPGGHTNALMVELLPGTNLFSFDSFGNYSYANLLPSGNATLALGGSSLRWEGYFDNINVNSCTGCPSATTYWSLTSGVCGVSANCLQPIGSYDVVPFGTNAQDLGSTSHNWFHTYTDFLVAQVVDVGTAITDYSAGLGTDAGGHTNALLLALLGSGTIMSLDSLGSYMYTDLLPNTTNARSLGSSTDVFANVYGENLWSVGDVVSTTGYAVGPFGGPYNFGVSKTCTALPTVVGGIVTAC